MSGPVDGTGVGPETNTGERAKQWYGAMRNLSAGNDRGVKLLVVCTG